MKEAPNSDSPVNRMSLQFDHFVMAARTLKEGMDHVQNQLQVPLEPGGQHQIMGTHNALLRLGINCYLEVIAEDPSLPPPQRPRWFGLDTPGIKKRIAEIPRPVHWVVRTPDYYLMDSKLMTALGRIIPMSRGQLRWKITVPDDGSLPQNGVLPSVIQWLSERHPAAMLPDRGCRLQSLEATLPDSTRVCRYLEAMGLKQFITILAGPDIRLKAVIKTPKGLKILE
jgi:hypothetical protein